MSAEINLGKDAIIQEFNNKFICQMNNKPFPNQIISFTFEQGILFENKRVTFNLSRNQFVEMLDFFLVLEGRIIKHEGEI